MPDSSIAQIGWVAVRQHTAHQQFLAAHSELNDLSGGMGAPAQLGKSYGEKVESNGIEIDERQHGTEFSARTLHVKNALDNQRAKFFVFGGHSWRLMAMHVASS
jgi:hypothetical protein